MNHDWVFFEFFQLECSWLVWLHIWLCWSCPFPIIPSFVSFHRYIYFFSKFEAEKEKLLVQHEQILSPVIFNPLELNQTLHTKFITCSWQERRSLWYPQLLIRLINWRSPWEYRKRSFVYSKYRLRFWIRSLHVHNNGYTWTLLSECRLKKNSTGWCGHFAHVGECRKFNRYMVVLVARQFSNGGARFSFRLLSCPFFPTKDFTCSISIRKLRSYWPSSHDMYDCTSV